MKTPREWANEFDRRWTENVRHFARDVGVLDLLAEVIGEALAEKEAQVASLTASLEAEQRLNASVQAELVRRAAALEAEVERLKKIAEGLADRVTAQSELLAKRAERAD